jgi:hypothetical protein
MAVCPNLVHKTGSLHYNALWFHSRSCDFKDPLNFPFQYAVLSLPLGLYQRIKLLHNAIEPFTLHQRLGHLPRKVSQSSKRRMSPSL